MSGNKTCKCEVCSAPYEEEFKQVCELKLSGLKIFIHKEASNVTLPRKQPTKKRSFILYNVKERQLKRHESISEMVQYRTRCYQCKMIMNTVRNLLDELNELKDNEIKGVCELCKHINPAGRCKRCEIIVNKFLSRKMKQYTDSQARFRDWMSKVNDLLTFILSSKTICNHPLFQRSVSTVEIEKLLKELKPSIDVQQPKISEYPSSKDDEISTKTNTQEKIEKILNKIKIDSEQLPDFTSEFLSQRWSSEGSCICKRLKERKRVEFPNISTNSETKITSGSGEKVRKFSVAKLDTIKEEELDESEDHKQITPLGLDIPPNQTNQPKSASKRQNKEDILKQKKSKQETSPTKKSVKPEDVQKDKTSPKTSPVKSPKEKSTKTKLSSMGLLLSKLKKQRKERPVKVEKAIQPNFASIESLPEIKRVASSKKIEEVESESVVECDQSHLVQPKEIIKGTEIVSYEHTKKVNKEIEPILFKVEANFSDHSIPEQTEKKEAINFLPTISPGKSDSEKEKSQGKDNEETLRGRIKYRLSDPAFIRNGWTVMPTNKIMRRMNIYKMEPTNPGTNWFERNNGDVYYNTGELLASINENGNGKWFYKSGATALEYYCPDEENTKKRIIIYSAPDDMENGKLFPETVLACFDYLGNGVVYDHYGKERIKYNQSEGIIIDPKIASPGRWKWHTLNEPPIIQDVFVDTYVKKPSSCPEILSPIYSRSFNKSNKIKFQDKIKTDEAAMLDIELEHFVKEQGEKLKQKFTPFQIKMKYVKVNKYFSLRILDQSNIYLTFNILPRSLKLNLGLKLKSKEIVDWETGELYSVATPYDRIPAKTNSLANIQSSVMKAKVIGNKIRKRD